MNNQQGKTRGAYARTDINETRAHEKKSRCKIAPIQYSKMKSACDEWLSNAGLPTNNTEEMHLKAMIKSMREERAHNNQSQ